MTDKEYERLTEKQLKGRKVKTLRPLDNGLGHVAMGRIFTIEGKRGGLSLIGPMCWSCGVQLRFSKVQPQSVELLAIGRP